jgi:c-di-AMP phosphodiesterase-like protein
MLISGKLVLLFMSAICLIFILIPLIIGIFLSQRILIIPTLLLIGYLIYIISLLKEEYNLCKKDHEYGIDEEIMEFCGFIPNETYIGHNFGIITKRDKYHNPIGYADGMLYAPNHYRKNNKCSIL